MVASSFAGARLSRRGALVALLLLAACGRDSLFTAPGSSRDVLPPPPHYPIIFVHGFNASSATWLTMVARFKLDGYTDAELVNFSYDYRLSNATTAQLIGKKVDSVLLATGAHHVDIITHSMGRSRRATTCAICSPPATVESTRSSTWAGRTTGR